MALRKSLLKGDCPFFENYRKLLEYNQPLRTTDEVIFPSDLVKLSFDYLFKHIESIEGTIDDSCEIAVSIPASFGIGYQMRMRDIVRSVWNEQFPNVDVSVQCVDDAVTTFLSVLSKNNISLQELISRKRFLVIDSEDFNFNVSLLEIIKEGDENCIKKLSCIGDGDDFATRYEEYIRSYILEQEKIDLATYRDHPEFNKILYHLDLEIKNIIEHFLVTDSYQLFLSPWFEGEGLDTSVNMFALQNFLKEKGIDPTEKLKKYINYCLSQSKISKGDISSIIFSGSIVSMKTLIGEISSEFGCTFLGDLVGDKSKGAAILAGMKMDSNSLPIWLTIKV